MASVGGVSGSNLTSSLYNSANVISGLASGLDTEGMIEGLVQSYQTKIQNLTNQATKLEWKQEAYRSIITKMVSFSSKYTSYTSSTNLLSASFFNNAIKVAAQGKYADKVTASGRTDSDVKLNSVTQLATSARYSTRSNLKGVSSDDSILAPESVKFDDTFTSGSLSGSLVLTYGSQTVSLVFDQYNDIIPETKTVNGQEVPLSKSEQANELYKMINQKLADTQISLSSGESKSAADLIRVTYSGGKISFADKSSGGNNVYISDASGNVDSILGLDLEDADTNKPASIDVNEIYSYVNHTTVAKQISGKTMNITLDGKTKSIELPKINEFNELVRSDGTTEALTPENYVRMVQTAVNKQFGEGKITVSNESGDNKSLQLKLKAPENSDLVIDSDAGKALGIGNSATNYVNTNKTLGELLPEGTFYKTQDGTEVKRDLTINGVKVGSYNSNTKLYEILDDINNSDAGVKVTFSQSTRQFTFTSKDTGSENKIEMGTGDDLANVIFGGPTDLSDPSKVRIRDLVGDSLAVQGETFSVNVDGKEVSFKFVGDNPTLKNITDKLADTLNARGDGTYDVSISESGALQVSRTDGDGTKQNLSVSYNSGVARNMFSSINSYTAGKDAEFEVEVNGQKMKMTRPSNSANIDGMTINFKSTFQAEDGDAITFQRTTDSDKIVDAIRAMVNDYNEIMSELRSQYATMPYQDSSGAFKSYEPLSDDDKATMSESAIANYEAKAKQGLLFNDTNLSGLYSNMLSIFTDGGQNQLQLKQMGISITYSSVDGSASLTLDENALREQLESDPDAVADVFTRATASYGQSVGVMQSLKAQMDRYAGLTGATKGVLVEQAGTPLSSLTLLNNTWQTQIDNLGTQVEKWQEKLSAQVDKYTSMFSQLETLIYQMNSQSSALAGLMGG